MNTTVEEGWELLQIGMSVQVDTKKGLHPRLATVQEVIENKQSGHNQKHIVLRGGMSLGAGTRIEINAGS